MWSITASACRKKIAARLLEPYVTTREKGTGLGLAIVGKHSGRARRRHRIARRPRKGCRVSAAPGCSCALPKARRKRNRPNASGNESRKNMARDCPKQAELSHGVRNSDRRRRSRYPRTGRGHPSGRRLQHADGARQRRCAERDQAAAAQSCVPGYLAAGQQARRLATARRDQAASTPTCRW